MDNSCAILVLGCDKNISVLNIFFDFLKKFWPNCKYPIYLGLEKSTVRYEGVSTLNSNEKQWAKVFISESDAHIMVNEDSDILDALRKVSDNIKIEVMENGEQGDLLIEYPDQVVDAGVNTQLTNIRRIMDEVN